MATSMSKLMSWKERAERCHDRTSCGRWYVELLFIRVLQQLTFLLVLKFAGEAPWQDEPRDLRNRVC
jgi:hypothetical protein